MQELEPGSVDMVFCDLPYGTTACKWDAVIPFDKLWAQYKRVCKPNAILAFTATQPFTTDLINSNRGGAEILLGVGQAYSQGISNSKVQAHEQA